jgi:hypothetical protein
VPAIVLGGLALTFHLGKPERGIAFPLFFTNYQSWMTIGGWILGAFAPLAIAKSSLRILGQSLAREFHPKGIHIVHVIVDGQIDTPRLRARDPNRATETVIPPDAIADAIIHAFKQPRNAWTHEIDIRPYVENF